MCINGKWQGGFGVREKNGWVNTGQQEDRFYSRPSHCTANILVKERKTIAFVGKQDRLHRALSVQRWSWEESGTSCLLAHERIPEYWDTLDTKGNLESGNTTDAWLLAGITEWVLRCCMIISSYCWHHHLPALSKSPFLTCIKCHTLAKNAGSFFLFFFFTSSAESVYYLSKINIAIWGLAEKPSNLDI